MEERGGKKKKKKRKGGRLPEYNMGTAKGRKADGT